MQGFVTRSFRRARWRAFILTLLAAAMASASALARPADGVDPGVLPATANYARAPDCSNVTIRMPLAPRAKADSARICPEPSNMPLLQGDSLICFAYSTAAMISQRIGVVVSPLDVATKYFFANPASLAKISSPAVQDELRRLGRYAARIRLNRSDVDIEKDSNKSRRPYVDKLAGGEEDLAALLYNIGGVCKDADLRSYNGFGHARAFLRKQRVKWSLFAPPKVSYRTIGSAPRGLHSARADAVNNAWVHHTNRLCERTPLPVPLLPVAYRMAADRAAVLRMLAVGREPPKAKMDHMLAMIDYALDHGRAPAVGYTYWVYEERPDDDPDLTADHSSVITGRRKVGGACQYRLRDNVGEFCSAMYPAISARCRNGRIWLTETELRSAIYSVVYLR